MKSEIELYLRDDASFIDLRSEKEFQKGSIPNSVNMPILYNREYEAVGIEYKKKGQKAAINLGHRLVSGEKKRVRVQGWCHYINENPNTKIFCNRGGLRSQIALKWITEYGLNTSLIGGGYKRIRRICIDTIQLKNNSTKKWMIIGGHTGSGKTNFINPYQSTIDLESIANHRGSAFGKKISNQPTAINFENTLAFQYLKNKSKWLLLEDESRLIGKNILKDNWYRKMQTSDLIILKVDLKSRVNNIANEYIIDPLENSINNAQLYSMMVQALSNIQKRLGGDRYSEIQAIMKEAFEKKSKDLHKTWIEKILTYYYDPMYNYKMEKRGKYIMYSGTPTEVRAYLRDQGVS